MSVKIVTSIVCTALALVTLSVHGAIQRTFVASSGADTNPCTIAQPCRSFGTAIGKTLAGGEVIVVDSAGYGIVTITQSVSIVAPPGVYAGVSAQAGQTGVTVNGVGIIVVLRGLSINGVGGNFGVYFTGSGSRLRIENCVVSGLAATGVLMDSLASELVATDTIVRDNGGAGFALTVDATMLLDGVHVEHNAGDGVFIFSNPAGTRATIRNSTLSYNTQAGVAAFMPSSPATTRIVVANSLLSQNSGDGATVGGNTDGQVIGVFSHNVFERNGLSGISAFNLATGGISSVDIYENTFSGNGNRGVKVEGFTSQVFMGHNYFARDEQSLLGGGFKGSYGDNSGAGGGGTVLLPQF